MEFKNTNFGWIIKVRRELGGLQMVSDERKIKKFLKSKERNVLLLEHEYHLTLKNGVTVSIVRLDQKNAEEVRKAYRAFLKRYSRVFRAGLEEYYNYYTITFQVANTQIHIICHVAMLPYSLQHLLSDKPELTLFHGIATLVDGQIIHFLNHITNEKAIEILEKAIESNLGSEAALLC